MRAGEERRVDARERIHRFPEELLAVRDNLAELVARVFAENVYREVPVLRGVYLTSGTQEGRPIDRVMNAMAQAFGRIPTAPDVEPASEAKSYFLGDLFTQVMFADHDLVVGSDATERTKRRLRFAVAALLALSAIGFVAGTGVSYVRNRSLLTSTRAEADTLVALATTSVPTPAALAALAPLRDRVSSLRRYDDEGAPFGMRLGLYRGSMLRPHLEAVYARAIRRILVEPAVRDRADAIRATVTRFEGGGEHLTPAEHGALYDDLREYLVLTEPKAVQEPALDQALSDFVAARVVAHWCARFHPAASPTERERGGSRPHVPRADAERSRPRGASRRVPRASRARGAERGPARPDRDRSPRWSARAARLGRHAREHPRHDVVADHRARGAFAEPSLVARGTSSCATR